ncbi:MAG: ATP-dependent helicase HrpB, partial [Bryobacteraceae bacterium]|nr:ATP-dependent helicase HrpB [Bryobacteraceae bacterium]
LRAMGIDNAMEVEKIVWLDAPPVASVQAGDELLNRLQGTLSAARLAELPVHPRIARLLLEAKQRGVVNEACRIAAHLSASGVRNLAIDVVDSAQDDHSWQTRQLESQLRRLTSAAGSDTGTSDDLRLAILSAYPDRVLLRKTVTITGWHAELLVAVDIEDRRTGPPLVRLASEVKPDWLLDLFPGRIVERNQTVWNRTTERVEAVSALLYDDLIIDENRNAPPNTGEAAQMLAQKAIEAGLHRWTEPDLLDGFLARVGFASHHSTLEPVTDVMIHEALADIAQGLRSFRELEGATAAGRLIDMLRAKLGPDNRRTLDKVAPERIALRNRQVKVNYSVDKPPSIASRLQDFFGMKETPRIANGQVPLVVELLAPNGRAVQTTTDLKGFWERLYPTVRRELSRRYPKHSWPENPD